MLKHKNVLDSLKGLSLVLISDDVCSCNVSMRSVTRDTAKKFNCYYITVLAKNEIEFCKKYDINIVPSVLLLNDNKLIAEVHGYQPEEILELYIEAKIKDFMKEETK